MARKKTKLPDAATLVRQKARATIGAVPATKVVPDPRRKPGKHKRDLAKEAADLATSRRLDADRA